MPTLSPQKRFQSKQAAKFHQELVLKDEFHDAIESALIQFIANEPNTADSAVAAASWHRVAGARAFVHTFLNISEQTKEKPIDTRANLDHKV